MRIASELLVAVARLRTVRVSCICLSALLVATSALAQGITPFATPTTAISPTAGGGTAEAAGVSEQTAPRQGLGGGGFQAVEPGGGSAPLFSASYPEYRIGNHDLLQVAVYEAPEFGRTVRVSPNGTIRLPMFKKPTSVVRLTYIEAEEAIAQALVVMEERHTTPPRMTQAHERPKP